MQRKLKSHLGKTGFIHVDFAFASAIFASLFFVSLLLFYSGIYQITETDELERLQAEADMLCDFLMSMEGEPRNWYTNVSDAQHVGLLSPYGNVSSQKVAAFNNQSSYFTILDSLSTGDMYVHMVLRGMDTNNVYLSFGTPMEGVYQGAAECYGSYRGETVKLHMEVWK